VAPGTDRGGAVRLADRVFEAVEAAATADMIDPALLGQLRAGFHAIQGEEPATPEDLLLKATLALRKAQGENGGFRIRAYEA
ncbi:MAG TPA: hypothetical protein VFQ22_12705, partial [Longimicrobiales bacterium]|nr:hypothetical protein [Longimicrobiales bacterium]